MLTKKKKKKKKEENSKRLAQCGHCRKDLTTCDDMSTICVHLSLEIVKVEFAWLAKEPA